MDERSAICHWTPEMNEFGSEKEKDWGVLVLQRASGKQEECTKSQMLNLPRFQIWINWMFAGISKYS